MTEVITKGAEFTVSDPPSVAETSSLLESLPSRLSTLVYAKETNKIGCEKGDVYQVTHLVSDP